MKIIYVDNQSGFYGSGQTLVLVFNVLAILTFAGVIVLTLAAKDSQTARLRGGRWLEVFSILLGCAVLFVSVGALLTAMAIDSSAPVVNELPKWMLLIEHTLGVLSGVALLYLAFFLLSGAKHGKAKGTASLVIVLWQTFLIIERFISFQQVTTVSDQFFETLHMVCFLLFLLYHTRCAAGLNTSRPACVRRSLLTAVFGLPLAVGQLAAVAVFGTGISGPSVVRSIVILASSLYAVCFAVHISSMPEEISQNA